MTPEQIEQERAAFEAWHKETFGYLPKKYKDGTFMSSSRADEVSPQDMFEGWLARAEQGGWISVEDRLPDRSDIAQFFIIYDENQKDKLKFGVAMFTGWKIENPTAWHNWIVYGNYTPEYVTHWQPLPQPPAGDHT